MTDPQTDAFMPVSRELVVAGILPWAGRRYEAGVKRLIRESPYDPLVLLVSDALLSIYREHAPANERMTVDDARRLGLESSASDDPSSFMSRIRRAFGNPT
ncbi:MAG: hypothetical protein ACKVVP_22990 [Chloroflexota bacterium]